MSSLVWPYGGVVLGITAHTFEGGSIHYISPSSSKSHYTDLVMGFNTFCNPQLPNPQHFRKTHAKKQESQRIRHVDLIICLFPLNIVIQCYRSRHGHHHHLKGCVIVGNFMRKAVPRKNMESYVPTMLLHVGKILWYGHYPKRSWWTAPMLLMRVQKAQSGESSNGANVQGCGLTQVHHHRNEQEIDISSEKCKSRPKIEKWIQ